MNYPPPNTLWLLRCLSRWSLIVMLLAFTSIAVYAGGIGSQPADSARGPESVELITAVRSPLAYRLQTASEALYWLMIGGTLIIFAGLFAQRASIRAAFMAACGIGQLAGSLGSFMRLTGIGDLAAQFATANSGGQAALVQSFLDLNRVIQPHYVAGTLLYGAGFLLVAWTAWEWMGFPRWLAVWLAIHGVLGLALFCLRATGSLGVLLLPVILLDAIIGLLGLQLALALTFWRPSPALVAG
jgi:hypothetical protein